jgi:tRNA nucleotidyltransferase (CCA-adding enzyme)
MGCFAGQPVIGTGLKHGTVSLMLDGRPYEITTYRVDGKYTDNRRPDTVRFVNVLKRDLARRDFSVNAMAYHPRTGLVDYYGGLRDLAEKRIKCVGNPGKRFQEDALRILRALRFAAVFGFAIEENTAEAMRGGKTRLHNIAKERIAAELNKLLLGDHAGGLLKDHFSVPAEVIPEINREALASLDAAPKDLILRLAWLFHDADQAADALARLKYDGDTAKAVTQLIRYRDAEILPERVSVKRWLHRIGAERLRQLLALRRDGDRVLPLVDAIIEQRQCYSLKDLAVNGRDLIDAGIPEGAQVGVLLNRLLDMVINEVAVNDKAALLAVVPTVSP